MREIHLVFAATVKERYAKVSVETGGMIFHFEGPISYQHLMNTVYEGNLVYFPESKVLNFEFCQKMESENGSLLIREVTGALVPDIADAAKVIEKAIHAEFPLIGPAIVLALRRKFNER